MAMVMGDLFGFDPFSDFRRMTRELANVNPNVQGPEWRPATDIIERPDYYEVDIDLPGIKKDNVNIELQADGHLSISGRRQYQGSEKDRVVTAERPVGNFSRLLRVPRALSAEHIKASMNDGVLTIRLPKSEIGPKRIPLGEGVETKAGELGGLREAEKGEKGEVERPQPTEAARELSQVERPQPTEGAKAEAVQQPGQVSGEQKGQQGEVCPQLTHFPPTREEIKATGRCAEDIYRKAHPEEYNQPPIPEDAGPLPPFPSRGEVTQPMFPEEGQKPSSATGQQLQPQQQGQQQQQQQGQQQQQQKRSETPRTSGQQKSA